MVKNRYIYHSRISEAKCREILRLFSIDLNATQISELTNISRNSIHKILKALRVRIAMLCEQDRVFDGEVEVENHLLVQRELRVKEVGELMVKLLYLVYINEMVKYIQGSYLIVPEIPYKRSLKVKSI